MNNKQTAKKPLSTYERIVLIIALICVGVLFVFKAISMQAQPDKVITYTVNDSAVSAVSQQTLSEKVKGCLIVKGNIICVKFYSFGFKTL